MTLWMNEWMNEWEYNKTYKFPKKWMIPIWHNGQMNDEMDDWQKWMSKSPQNKTTYNP